MRNRLEVHVYCLYTRHVNCTSGSELQWRRAILVEKNLVRMRNQFQLQTSNRGESKSGFRWSFPVKTFGFPFGLRLWDLTKRRDDIVVADMVVDMAADMEVHMMADMELDMVADMEVDMVADKVVDMMAKQKLLCQNNFPTCQNNFTTCQKMFEPKRCLTRGPEWPFICLDFQQFTTKITSCDPNPFFRGGWVGSQVWVNWPK